MAVDVHTEELESHYGFKVISIKPVYRSKLGTETFYLVTNKGDRCLKKYSGKSNHLSAVRFVDVINHLTARGFTKIPKMYMNSDDTHLTSIRNDTCVLIEWLDADYVVSPTSGLLSIGTTLGKFHHAIAGLREWASDYTSGFLIKRKQEEYDGIQTLYDRIASKQYVSSGEVDLFAVIKPYIDLAAYDVELLSKMAKEYDTLCEKARIDKEFIYGDLNNRNVLIVENQAIFIDFDEVKEGLRLADLKDIAFNGLSDDFKIIKRSLKYYHMAFRITHDEIELFPLFFSPVPYFYNLISRFVRDEKKKIEFEDWELRFLETRLRDPHYYYEVADDICDYLKSVLRGWE